MKKLEDTGERLIAKGNEQTLTYGEHLSRYLATLDLAKGKVVLDIASGTGYGTAMLADSDAKKVIGIDYSEDAIAYSKENYHRENIEYMVGDAHNLPLSDNSVDLVVSLETIEHLQDPKKFVQEVKRVLKKDGVFVVSTPNDDEFMEGNEFHLHEFQFAELKKLIQQNFKTSNFYFQGTYFAAALHAEDQFTLPNKNLTQVAKTFKQTKEKAIYFIAVASNAGEVPELEQNIVLADRWNTKEDIERDSVRNNRVASLQTHINDLQSNQAAQQQELRAIYSSTSWRATKLLRKAGNLLPRKKS